MNLSLIKPGFENISLESSIVEYKLEVDRYTEETIAIPVNVLSNSEIKFNYFPKEITVKYFISIDDYKKTSTVHFRVDCIFDMNKSVLVPVLSKKPDFIKNARLSSNQIQIIILE